MATNTATQLVEKILDSSPNELVHAVSSFLATNKLSAPLSLLILLLTCFLVFFSFLTKINNILKGSAHAGIAFDSTCDALVKIAADDIYKEERVPEFLAGLKACPREVIDNRDEKLTLRYVLLDQAIADAPSVGLTTALREILRRKGIRSSLQPPPPPVAFTYILLMLVLYIFCAFVYCVMIVNLGHYFCGNRNCATPLLGSFVFPGATNDTWGATTSVMVEYYIFSVQIALPFLIGVTLYEKKEN